MHRVTALHHIPATHPFKFGLGFCFAKGVAADLIVQHFAEAKQEFDGQRCLTLGTFSMVFCGAWQFALFNRIMPALCPGAASFASKPLHAKLKDAAGLRDLGLQVFIENGFNNALLYFPVFYTIQAALHGRSFRESLVDGPQKFIQTSVPPPESYRPL